MKQNRLPELDIFKGYAIIFMVIFHICYDLNYFQYIDINLNGDKFWIAIRYSIVTMFLLAVGVSLALAHKVQVQWHKVKKRLFILGGASLLITLVTYVVFPQTWVYFGILHFVLLASLLGLLFLPYPIFSLLLATFIIIGSIFGLLDMHWLYALLKSPLHLPSHTVDLVPFVPWFAVVLMGMTLVRYGYHEKVLRNRLLRADLRYSIFLAVLGRNALLIYLVHQPILFGLFWLSKL